MSALGLLLRNAACDDSEKKVAAHEMVYFERPKSSKMRSVTVVTY